MRDMIAMTLIVAAPFTFTAVLGMASHAQIRREAR